MSNHQLTQPGFVSDTSAFDAHWLKVIAHSEVEDNVRDFLDGYAKTVAALPNCHDGAVAILVRRLSERTAALEEAYDRYLAIRDDPNASEQEIAGAVRTRTIIGADILRLRASIRKLESA
jgi:hypothetical protein